jgi:predicted O-methyltransferase YrrM
MSEDLWSAVDSYFFSKLMPRDEVLEAALRASEEAGLPPIQVSPTQGKLLHLLARVHRARRILEIGTLGGYSTIWLGRALPPDGRLISLEIDPRHAEVARANIGRADLSDVVEIRLGRALDTLPVLEGEHEPFDMVFIDADKVSNPAYFEWALRLTHLGSLIVIDNVVRAGAIADPANDSPEVAGVRRLLDLIAAEPRVAATAIQTVGLKGHDGFAMALVVGEIEPGDPT